MPSWQMPHDDDRDAPAIIRLPRNKSCTHEAFHEAAIYDLLAHADQLVLMRPPSMPSNPYPPEQTKDAERAGVFDTSYRDCYDAQRHIVDHLTPFLATVLRHADRPQTQGVTGASLGAGAEITTAGWCGSDLFLQCKQCKGDRVVIEIKGPTAQMNRSKADGRWQTTVYEDHYARTPQHACDCPEVGLAQVPYFVLLEARERTREQVAKVESIQQSALRNWVWLTYSDAFVDEVYMSNALVGWLMFTQNYSIK